MPSADEHTISPGTMSQTTLVAMIALALVLTMGLLSGFVAAVWLAQLMTLLTEGGLAAMIVVGAAGLAWPVVRRLTPAAAPRVFRLVTSSAMGLWLLGTAMLAFGSLGVLSGWVWWLVIVCGVASAAWHGRKVLEAWRPSSAKRYDGRALLWVLAAAAAGIWLAGALHAPGCIGAADSYDVVEYHLQLPRQFLNAGVVASTPNNAYGYYPLGLEMLYLLAMCLRGGAYEGMYLANIMHGVFGVLAVAGIFSALKGDDERRGRFATALLVGVPLLLMLSWMAMVELAEVCYMAMAAFWMRSWLKTGRSRPAICVGLMLGAACAIKYLSVGLIAVPVLAVMFAMALVGKSAVASRARRIGQVVIAGVLALLPMAPWLVRNAVYTGNPVFPLATNALGRGHWTPQAQQRWIAGHDVQDHPPVPVPPEWTPPASTAAAHEPAETFYYNFLTSELLNPLLVMLVLVAVAVMVAAGRSPDAWDVSLLAVLAIQLAVWACCTRDMPTRFLAPAVVPMVLLGAGVLARLAGVQVNPLRKKATRPVHGAWGMYPAVTILLTIVVVNIVVAKNIFIISSSPIDAPWPGSVLASQMSPYRAAAELPNGSKLLLIGEAKAFYFPPGTIYATAFDSGRLADKLGAGLAPQQAFARLRDSGVTHIWVDWGEIWRLAATYGYPELLSAGLWSRLAAGDEPGLELLDRLGPYGLQALCDLRLVRYENGVGLARVDRDSSGAMTQPAGMPSTLPASWNKNAFPLHWPMVTIYALTPVPPSSAPAE